ncbi:glycosyltransferase [Paraclostridium bifermentans]|uniref:glycosyltransferase n=2 Tax=Paraclostridium bifermentans TaxID=1490 RepID=UPI0022E930CB|nr:glycosyltransferase [Paraclostridium bifermentans]
MLNEKIMIIDIPFNILDHPFWCGFKILYSPISQKAQTKEWIDPRIDVFMDYTAKSLINQTNQNFKCILRHTPGTKDIIEDSLSRYPKLPDNIIFTDDGDNLIKEIISPYKYVFHIRIDSDNMFSPDYIDQLYKIENFLLGLRYPVKDDHWGAISYVHKVIPTPSYMIIIHKLNVSNDFQVILEYPFIKTWLASEDEKEKALKFFKLK